MRILYIDIDSLRPDHLGCYGYHRNTSPNIDRLATRGARCTNYYCTDAPCLPSRTSLFTSRFGIHTGVVNHGGLEADIRSQGTERQFANRGPYRSWMSAMKQAGYYTVMVSPFPNRHAAWHVIDGFREAYDTGKGGMEIAEEATPTLLRWIRDRGKEDNWFVHFNLWDPHTPYRTPMKYGNPFEDNAAPDWLTEEIIQQHRASFAPHGARELHGWSAGDGRWPRTPNEITSRQDFKKWIDGYDVAIRYADDHVGHILNALADADILDETLVIISADHGENQGELNVYGDHQTADYITSRVPLIVVGPGIQQGHVDEGLHYNIDLAPTITELVGGQPAPRWDGQSFLPVLTQGKNVSRTYLVVSQNAWACQRSVRFDQWMLIRTYHDGLKDFPDLMLFDVENDPHETNNLVSEKSDVVADGLRLLDTWTSEMLSNVPNTSDPMWHVIEEGGPFHTRNQLEKYLQILRESGRSEAAKRLESRHSKFNS
ncbi:TPA: sulfatase [Candidatus Poribacteria bacterium]|nr:sulfatase [Candidatus Poribacteria bacterium]HIA65516.1 sulfatase [Candidatus Poribacteria bacterium]HIB91577.1 sulfatase [Candidatus Poribacteria bacterium]HIC02894.1 sulfatase [Candidatus Poribacteria bacterium]HIN27419.1 sulfatase [Candidatus Poribacteria bacterium]